MKTFCQGFFFGITIKTSPIDNALYNKLKNIKLIYLITIYIVKMEKLKRFFTYLILIVFLSPSIFKSFHHHEHYICAAKNETHYHEYLENCEIYNFEFSVFSSSTENVENHKLQLSDLYCNLYNSSLIVESFNFSFLLRAPPLDKNT